MDTKFMKLNGILRSIVIVVAGLSVLLITRSVIPPARAENPLSQSPANRAGSGSRSGTGNTPAAPPKGSGSLGVSGSATQNTGTIGGGMDNVAGQMATVSGGYQNNAGGLRATIGGGSQNHAKYDGSVVGGGSGNRAYGFYAVIAGGFANEATDSYTTIAGGNGNRASERHATVGGGTANRAAGFGAVTGGGIFNSAQATYSTVSGGIYNRTSGLESMVGGGTGNAAGGEASGISAGLNNRTTDDFCIVSGGRSNLAGNGNAALNDSAYATVSGGLDNKASGAYATVAGGRLNQAAGDYSFAAGRRARVGKSHGGSILFSDARDYDFPSVAANEFAVRATGGFRLSSAIDRNGNAIIGSRLIPGSGAWDTLNDRNAMKNVSRVNPAQILERLAELNLFTWSYDTQDPSLRHMGPTSRDFFNAFELGTDDGYISTVDADGVALGAVQGLYRLVQKQNVLLNRQQQQIRTLQTLIDSQRIQIDNIMAVLNRLDDTERKK